MTKQKQSKEFKSKGSSDISFRRSYTILESAQLYGCKTGPENAGNPRICQLSVTRVISLFSERMMTGTHPLPRAIVPAFLVANPRLETLSPDH